MRDLTGQPFAEKLEAIQQAMRAGRYRIARERIAQLEQGGNLDAVRTLRLAEYLTLMGRHDDAARLCREAVALSPDDPAALYSLGAAETAVGRIDEAERCYDAVIAAKPRDWDAWVNRSTLRAATADRNHVAQLQDALAQNRGSPDAVIGLGYAAAKELEDLGRYPEVFDSRAPAAATRRARLSYRVEDDIRTIDLIIDAFDEGTCAAAAAPVPAPGPVFILGLPRSGTTLVDRILSSHSQVTSLGELQDFAQALVQGAGPVRSREELVDSSRRMNHAGLGKEYLRRLDEYDAPTDIVTDKTPLNFLYVGLIALSLPQARIVHVRRGAMDACYAMFKTLFRMGYPFSYSIDDLAQYRVAYDRLMQHWRTVLPERMIEIEYEALVADQAAETAKLLCALGLPWEDNCLQFHTNRAPVATASSSQVRAPIHTRSVGLWKRYRAELAPLERKLRAADVSLELA